MPRRYTVRVTWPKRAPIYHSDCIELPLTRGLSTFVDLDCPADILARTWHASAHGYAETNVRTGDVKKTQLLHSMLLGKLPKGLKVDHIDRDKLNNRRANLRTCTNHQNLSNQGPRTGRFRGVQWLTRERKWYARITCTEEGKRRYRPVGYFDDEEAARAWDAAALASGLYDPDFLYLNFPKG